MKSILGRDRRWTLPLIALGVSLVAALAGACGSGGDGASGVTTPGAMASPTAVSPEQQLLEQAVLRVEDLPTGLAQVDASISTNEDVASGEANPEEELAQLESWGRLLGYEVSFVPGPDASPLREITAVSSAASLYRDVEGASASFADAIQRARAADWPASYPDLSDIAVTEVDRRGLADQIIWIRISGLQSGEGARLFIEDFVVLRRDRLRGFLRVVSLVEPSAGREASLEEVADLAALQVQRIDAALQEG